jgi:hypothetical protein
MFPTLKAAVQFTRGGKGMKPIWLTMFVLLSLPFSQAQDNELLNQTMLMSPDVEAFRKHVDQLLVQKKESFAKAHQSLPGVSFYLSPRSDVIRVVVKIEESDGMIFRMPVFDLNTSTFFTKNSSGYLGEIFQGIDIVEQIIIDDEKVGKIKLLTKDQVEFKGSIEEQRLAKKVFDALEQTSSRYVQTIRQDNPLFTGWNSSLFEHDGRKYILVTALVLNEKGEADTFPIVFYPLERLDEKTIEGIGQDAFEHVLNYFFPQQPPEQVGENFIVENDPAPFQGGIFCIR